MSDDNARFPHWLKRKIAYTGKAQEVTRIISTQKLHTVCTAAKCPNRGECFSRGSAAFLILGDVCTRECAFCGVTKGVPKSFDENANEAKRLANAAAEMKLSHVVVTSVTRDDLSDGGASVFADCVKRLREKIPSAKVELLIPDFAGCQKSLATVLESCPDVLNHNMETVSRLYPQIRPQAIYSRSLELLKRAADFGKSVVKSGIMVGLGETESEVINLMRDLRNAGCTVITIGQYLRPSSSQVPVAEFISPEKFAQYEEVALDMGFESAFCSPYVRSSLLRRALV